MCKPTTRRDEYGIYECSYTFPNRIVMATGDTPDVAYAAWVDKMILTVTDQGESISSLKIAADYWANRGIKS